MIKKISLRDKNIAKKMLDLNTKLINGRMTTKKYQIKVMHLLDEVKRKPLAKEENLTSRVSSKKELKKISTILSSIIDSAYNDKMFREKIKYYLETISNFYKNPKGKPRFMKQWAMVNALRELNKINNNTNNEYIKRHIRSLSNEINRQIKKRAYKMGITSFSMALVESRIWIGLGLSGIIEGNVISTSSIFALQTLTGFHMVLSMYYLSSMRKAESSLIT